MSEDLAPAREGLDPKTDPLAPLADLRGQEAGDPALLPPKLLGDTPHDRRFARARRAGQKKDRISLHAA
jgi:hypothetical protein